MKKPKGARPYSRAEKRRLAKEIRRRFIAAVKPNSLHSRAKLRENFPVSYFHPDAVQKLEAEAKARKPPPRKRLPKTLDVVQELEGGQDVGTQ